MTSQKIFCFSFTFAVEKWVSTKTSNNRDSLIQPSIGPAYTDIILGRPWKKGLDPIFLVLEIFQARSRLFENSSFFGVSLGFLLQHFLNRIGLGKFGPYRPVRTENVWYLQIYSTYTCINWIKFSGQNVVHRKNSTGLKGGHGSWVSTF